MPETNSTSAPETVWQRGRFDGRRAQARLLFGQMWEDATIERELFSPGEKVFAIASAGCTAIALARHGCQVSACDINPTQVEYARRRAEHGSLEHGQAERLLSAFRFSATCLGLTPAVRREFALLDDPATQADVWRRQFDRPRIRTLLRWLLHPRLLQFRYASPFLRSLPANFADVLWKRLARGFATHSNRDNPFAWRLLLGREQPPVKPASTSELNCVRADACEYLEASVPNQFAGLTLSNILDGATPEFAERLASAARHAAAPNATVVLRSFDEPRSRYEEEWATKDRALMWGRIVVCPVVEFTG